MLILRAFIPALSWIVVSHPLAEFEQFSSSRFTQPEPGAKKAPSIMSRIGNELLSNSSNAPVSQNESLGKDTWNTRDFLSLLVRATDLTENRRVLDDETSDGNILSPHAHLVMCSPGLARKPRLWPGFERLRLDYIQA